MEAGRSVAPMGLSPSDALLQFMHRHYHTTIEDPQVRPRLARTFREFDSGLRSR